ncbi:hypothetical protein AX15_002548 [Amanita polypyramis BW_CC]|nr:hypothetical protein AX15_002548 [Amanita polypyramis BW_CC]
MSRAAENLPPTARAIALLLASTPSVQDAQPGVLHQLLEFAHRYTSQVLTDASVYAEHAGHGGKIELDDVMLAVQARVGWEFGGRVPKEYILSLANQVNATPLPSVPEVFGVRLPPGSECLTGVDFDLVPHKPPPDVKLYDEEIEEIQESESEEDEDADMEPATMPPPHTTSTPSTATSASQEQAPREEAPFPISAIQIPSEMEVLATPGAGVAVGEEGSDVGDDEDGLFAGGDDEEEDSDAMEEVQTTVGSTNGTKRKLVEEEDYD